MKTLHQFALAIALGAIAIPSNAATKHFKIDQANFQKLDASQQQRVLDVGARWDAIADMDRSTLAKSDRSELRNEVKALKTEVKDINRNGNVIYISTAGIIIIVLLLILIL